MDEDTLVLAHCREVTTIPPKFWQHIETLQDMRFAWCRNMTEVPVTIGHFYELQRLSFEECPALQTVPASVGMLRCLTMLAFHKCDSLTRLPAEVGDLAALETLEIMWCPALQALPDTVGKLCQMQRLQMSRCDALSALPDSLPPRLQQLSLHACHALCAIPAHRGIETLYVSQCPQVTDIPDVPSIRNLELHRCDAMQHLPNQMPDLRSLRISMCPSIAALPNRLGTSRRLVAIIVHDCRALTVLPFMSCMAAEVLELQEMRRPPPEVVRAGCHAVRQYMHAEHRAWNVLLLRLWYEEYIAAMTS